MWICWKVTYLLFFYGEFCSSENQLKPGLTSIAGLQGRSIMFPIQISDGYVKNERRDTIAALFEGKFKIDDEHFGNHIRWHNETRYISFYDLRTGDSGTYIIEYTANKTRINNYFQITVYEVPQPQVSLYDNRSCTWQCSVENGRDVNLTWYKENVRLNWTSNPDNNISLSLHLRAEHSSTYECVASNPAINQTTQLLHSDTQHCFASPDHGRKHDSIIISGILSVFCVTIVGGLFLFLRRRRRNEYIQAQSANEESQNEVQYSEVLHNDIRLTQGLRPHVPELATEGEEPPLTSIYAKIQPHPPEATGTGRNATGSGSAVLGRL
ncbi:uncharacterized protein LOC134072071 isoform X2 [Sardina pilchardus]|uniref:uncharacterized protein LOC134072071 isoform X2 n=1 Tax=Sardina pilchardus TaxID=27697 RepID=UPI002E157E3E